MPKNRTKRFGRLINIPLIGYVVDLIVAFFRLPKNDWRVRECRTELRQLDERFTRHETELRQLDERFTRHEQSWRAHLPAFLNAVSSVGGMGFELQRQKEIADRHWTSIGELWQRLEFVRKEIMFEIGARSAVGATPKNDPVVLDKAKVQASLKKGVRLNLGCGHVALGDYLNVDMRELPGVDIVAQVDNLPFPPQSVAEIFSSHVLEHFTREELKRSLLPYWRSLLHPGGVFRAIVPDGEAMVAATACGEIPFSDFREVILGGQEYNGDFHYDFFTVSSLSELLQDAGFNPVEIAAKGRRNGKCFEFEIVAKVA